MEALQSYRRPFFGKGTKMVVQPLNLADVQAMTGSAPPVQWTPR